MVTSAVITGDIVKSTSLEPGTAKKLINRVTQIIGPYKYEFYRGDSFQAYVKDAREALKIVIQIRAEARKFSFVHDIRTSIGIGKVDSHLKKISTSSDEAFVLSGRAFDSLAKTDTRLAIVSNDEKANYGFSAIASFVDFIFRGLTSKQSEVLVELLKSNTQREVAKKLKKSESTIHKHTQSTGWHEILRLLQDYENLVSTIK